MVRGGKEFIVKRKEMGLQINKDLNRKDGLTIPSGSVVSWNTSFIAGTKIVRFTPCYIFLSVADRDDYFNNVPDSPEPSLSGSIKDLLATYDYVMTDAEYIALNTATGVMDIVQDYLKAKIVENSNEYLIDTDIVIVPSFL